VTAIRPIRSVSVASLRRAVLVSAIPLGLAVGFAATAVGQHELDPEVWIEMRKMARAKGPAPSIEEDVAALAGPGARRAGPRLVDRGPEVLPAAHAALLAPELEPRHGLALLQVMGPLAEESSVPVVLELLRRDPKHPLRRDALLILATLPATDDAAVFVSSIASDDGEAWRTRRMAFTWFGLQRDSRGRPFAEALRGDPDPERRVAGLFVLARLGDETALEPIAEMLAAGAPSSSRDTLLLGLAELATPDEFERLAPSALDWSEGYRDALRYARYRAAPASERPALCLEMVRAQMPGHREIGVRCLLETGHADDLRPLAALSLEAPGHAALVRNEIRKAGWQVVDTDTEFRIVPGAAASSRR
jgi:HEAT repeat protein